MQYLSNADDRLKWQANELPSDDLCVENAIMIKRFNRYPLVIDPSGQATEFIMNEYKDRKITKTRCAAATSEVSRQTSHFSVLVSVFWTTPSARTWRVRCVSATRCSCLLFFIFNFTKSLFLAHKS